MLYVKDKIVKYGGVNLGGQVQTVEIQESSVINTTQDKKGRIKKTQLSGYEQSKITIDILLEDTKNETTIQQLLKIQRLFKAPNQKNAKLLKIVNQDCDARGITKAYFKSLTSKKVISESKRVVSLELCSPKIAGITVKKIKSNKKKTAKKGNKNKSKKEKSKSPAKDTKSTQKGKKAAKSIIKK